MILSTEDSSLSQFRLLTAKLAIVLVPVAVTCYLILVLADIVSGGNDYILADLEKYNRLATILSPKLVLVGGSATAFGIDSSRLEKSLGMPVVNMSLHAAVGLKFMLYDVVERIANGDIVIVMPEYEQFCGKTANGGDLVCAILWNRLSALNNLNTLGQWHAVVRSSGTFLNHRLNVLIKHMAAATGLFRNGPKKLDSDIVDKVL